MKKSNDQSTDFKIVFQDHHITIANKMAGMPVQSVNKDIDLETILGKMMGFQVHPITRLDQSVSGLVLFAHDKRSAAKWSELIRNNEIEKTYLAVIEGKLIENDVVSLKHKLVKIKNKAKVNERGDTAELKFVVLKAFDNYSLIKIKTETGRFHQIRCQLEAFGHPIKGDIKYGSKRTNKKPGILLHCNQMSFTHPISSEDICITSSPPDDINWHIFMV